MDSPSKLLSRDCCPHPLGRRQTDAGAHESLGKPAKPTAGFPQRPLGLVCAWLSAGVTRFGLGRYLVVAGFEVSTSGRFSPVHRGGGSSPAPGSCRNNRPSASESATPRRRSASSTKRGRNGGGRYSALGCVTRLTSLGPEPDSWNAWRSLKRMPPRTAIA